MRARDRSLAHVLPRAGAASLQRTGAPRSSRRVALALSLSLAAPLAAAQSWDQLLRRGADELRRATEAPAKPPPPPAATGAAPVPATPTADTSLPPATGATAGTSASGPDRRPRQFDAAERNSMAFLLRQDVQLRRSLTATSGGTPAELIFTGFSPGIGDLGTRPNADEVAAIRRQANALMDYLRTLPALAQPRDLWPELHASIYGRNAPRPIFGSWIGFSAWPKGNVVTDKTGRLRSTGEAAFTYLMVNTESVDNMLHNPQWKDELGQMGFALVSSDEFPGLLYFVNGEGILLPSGAPLYRPVTIERVLRANLRLLFETRKGIERGVAERERAIEEFLRPDNVAARQRERQAVLDGALASGNEVAIRRARQRIEAGDAPELKVLRERAQPFPAQREALDTLARLQQQWDTLDAASRQQPACVRTPDGRAVSHTNLRVVPGSDGDCEPVVEINTDLVRTDIASRTVARYLTVRSRACRQLQPGTTLPGPETACRKHLDLLREIDWNRVRAILELP